MRILAIIAASTAVIAGAVSGQRGDVSRPPIIDMHMHAVPAEYFGKPPTKMHTAVTTRVIPAILSNGQVPLDSIRAWAQEKRIRVIGELTFQYAGYEFSDPLPERHFALAEELDLPIGIHVGPGAPGHCVFT